jgi:two-component system sensor histidine kinase ChiS
MSQVKRGEEIASTNSSKALRDIESILKMSFVEETKKAEIMKPISLNKTISGIIKDSEFQIKAKNLKVNVDIPKDADKVLMNARDSLLLFTNVINNAIKFTEKGNIKIEAAVEKSLVEMRVTDTGRGVGLNEIDKVFDKFYKRHAALPGTGLGLSICKEITERNKGEIEVRSKGLNKGTTVIVRLPKAPEKGGKK